MALRGSSRYEFFCKSDIDSIVSPQRESIIVVANSNFFTFVLGLIFEEMENRDFCTLLGSTIFLVLIDVIALEASYTRASGITHVMPQAACINQNPARLRGKLDLVESKYGSSAALKKDFNLLSSQKHSVRAR